MPPFYRLLGSHNNRLCLGLHSLAEVLAKRYGVDVKILNMDSESHEQYASWPEIYAESPHFEERLKVHEVWIEYAQWLKKLQPDIVIVGAGDLVLPTVDFGVPQVVKRIGELTRDVWGCTSYVYGVFPTLSPAEFYGMFDGVIVSEAEDEAISDRLMKQEQGLILGQLTEDLDEVPFLQKERLVVPVHPANMDYIVGSRGCYWHCYYCVTPVVCQRRVRLMTPQRFVDECQFRVKKYGLEALYIADMNGLVPHWRGKAICEEIIRRGLKFKWWCEVRSDCVNDEMCELAKAAGCTHFKLGVEGSNPVMAALGKVETEEIARKAVETVKRHGLDVVCYTMLGAPGLKDEDFQRSYEFMRSLEATHYVINMTVPHFGTPLFAQLEEQLTDDWQHLDARLRDFWGLREETVQKFMDLNKGGRKEDSGIRKYGKK